MAKELPEGFDIRYSEASDLSDLEKWFSDPKEREPFPFETDGETTDALKNWIGFAKYKASLTGVIGNHPCAVATLFLMPYRKVAHHASFYLIVDPAFRKRGIGASMVRNLMHLAKTRFRLEGLYAEIFEPSSLPSVLSPLGFETYARQENFVRIDGQRRARRLMEVFFS